MRLLRLPILAVLVLMVAPVLAQDSVPRAEPTSCWMDLPDGIVEGEDVDCGYLIVPEDRSSDTGSTIQLAFAILYAPAEAPMIWYLLRNGTVRLISR